MQPPTPTTDRASDGLLAFALAALAIGLIMVCNAAQHEPTSRLDRHTLASLPAADNPTGTASARSIAAHHRPVPHSMRDRASFLNEKPSPRRHLASSGDPRDDLLAMAALQRRWGLPSTSYAAGSFGS
jgi:hypothetical protein